MESFETELRMLINKHSLEGESADTPDFVLANYLLDCLDAFTSAVKKRNDWYNMDSLLKNESTVEVD